MLLRQRCYAPIHLVQRGKFEGKTIYLYMVIWIALTWYRARQGWFECFRQIPGLSIRFYVYPVAHRAGPPTGVVSHMVPFHLACPPIVIMSYLFFALASACFSGWEAK